MAEEKFPAVLHVHNNPMLTDQQKDKLVADMIRIEPVPFDTSGLPVFQPVRRGVERVKQRAKKQVTKVKTRGAQKVRQMAERFQKSRQPAHETDEFTSLVNEFGVPQQGGALIPSVGVIPTAAIPSLKNSGLAGVDLRQMTPEQVDTFLTRSGIPLYVIEQIFERWEALSNE